MDRQVFEQQALAERIAAVEQRHARVEGVVDNMDQKLDKLIDAMSSLVRIEERQQATGDRLAMGAQTFQDHESRIRKCEMAIPDNLTNGCRSSRSRCPDSRSCAPGWLWACSAGAQDVLVKNVAGSVVLSTEEGDGLKVDRTSRRVTLTKALQQAKVNLSYSPSITPNSDAGNIQQVFCNNGTAFAINTPSGTASAGQKLTIRVSNISGGSLGTLTWGAGYKLASWTQPANGFSRSITFFYDDSTPAWVEIGRTSADIPN